MQYKILSLLSFLLIFTIQGISQNNMRFGILAGANLQTITGKDFEGKKLENDMILGFHAGLNVQIPLAPQFYLQPGLMFSTKGAKNSEDGFTSTYNLSYLELPINFVYKGALGNGYFLIGFGPYLGYAVMGKAIGEGYGLTVESDIEFKNEVSESDPFTNAYLKAMDVGANVFAGYEMGNGIFVQLNTQLGLVEINPTDKRIDNDETSLKNTGFGLSLGFRF
jgi:hypothetical protein